MRRKIESSSASFTGCIDRFVTEGYKPQVSAKDIALTMMNMKELDGLGILIPCEDEYLEWFKKEMKA